MVVYPSIDTGVRSTTPKLLLAQALTITTGHHHPVPATPGKSSVGKSSLINSLLGEAVVRVQAFKLQVGLGAGWARSRAVGWRAGPENRRRAGAGG